MFSRGVASTSYQGLRVITRGQACGKYLSPRAVAIKAARKCTSCCACPSTTPCASSPDPNPPAADGLRRHCGSKPYDHFGRNGLTTGAWLGWLVRLRTKQPAALVALRRQRGRESYDHFDAKAYDGSIAAATAGHPASRNRHRLRPKRGNPATNYDANRASTRKSLRRQNGRIYDDKEIGNTCAPHSWPVPRSGLRHPAVPDTTSRCNGDRLRPGEPQSSAI